MKKGQIKAAIAEIMAKLEGKEINLLKATELLFNEIDEVEKDMEDYRFLLTEVPKVYENVTGGLLSKPMYKAEDVIRYADDYTTALIRGRVEDGLSDMVANDVITEEVRKIIMENYEEYI